MLHDAIVGARYMDTVFSSQFTIVEVRAETDDDLPDESDVTVVLDYDDVFDEPIEQPLDRFKDLSGIYVVEVPEHAGN